MSDFQITRATRQGVIPLIGLYSESGCGKTMSALLLARGLVGPNGQIHMIDTESRRGKLYADVIPGGYEHLDFQPPFSPARYVGAMETVIRDGAKVIVVDSMSHEHEGLGGILDMAAENESRSGRPGLHNWKQPKFEHGKMMQFLLRAPVPVICCIRAKFKTRQVKEHGKTAIVKDEYTSPIQSEDFIFEMTAHGEILQDHSFHLTKCSHPDLRKCFPEKGPITIQHGEMIAKWCAAAGGGSTAAPTMKSASEPTEQKALKSKLWQLTINKHKGDAADLEAYLKSANLIDPDASLSAVSLEKLRSIVATIEKEGLP